MANKLDSADLTWKYIKHITYSDHSHFLHRDDRFNVQWEQITNRDGQGWVGEPKDYYFIDGVDREFTDLEEMIKCWNERNDFDDPNNEVNWVKVIVPKPEKLKVEL